MASQLARQLGLRGGALEGVPYSTYKNMPYRLDKSRSALAEARLKSLVTTNIHLQGSFFWSFLLIVSVDLS